VRRRTEAEEKHIGKATGRPAKHQAAEREEPDLGSPSRPVRRYRAAMLAHIIRA